MYNNDDPFDKESAMIIIRSIDSNNTITKLYLPIILHEDDINFVTTEAEIINFTRKSHNKDIVEIHLSFFDQKDKSPIGRVGGNALPK